MSVTQKEFGGIDKDGIAVFSGNFKAPEYGLGERGANGVALVRIISDRAIFLVLSDQQYLLAAALKMDDIAFARFAAIEADIIRADAVGERFVHDEWRVPLCIFNTE